MITCNLADLKYKLVDHENGKTKVWEIYIPEHIFPAHDIGDIRIHGFETSKTFRCGLGPGNLFLAEHVSYRCYGYPVGWKTIQEEFPEYVYCVMLEE